MNKMPEMAFLFYGIIHIPKIKVKGHLYIWNNTYPQNKKVCLIPYGVIHTPRLKQRLNSLGGFYMCYCDYDENHYGSQYKSEDSAYTTDEWYDCDPDDEW